MSLIMSYMSTSEFTYIMKQRHTNNAVINANKNKIYMKDSNIIVWHVISVVNNN